MTTANITATVMKGFGTGVGGFSNTATIMYAMAAIFDKPGHEDQKAEIMQRIKLLREIVGQEIDRIKGADKPSLPQDWKKFQQILPTDTPEEKISKMRSNAMIVSKKPYFFRYLYPELNQRFKQFESSYNQISRDMFGIKFKKLLLKEDKTEDEKMLIRRYQKYSPLITAPCTMNKLCREFENIDFDIKFNKNENGKKPIVSKLPTFSRLFASSYSADRFNYIKNMYQEYTAKRNIKHLSNLLESSSVSADADDYSEIRSSIYDALIQSLQNKLSSEDIGPEEFLFYCSKLFDYYPKSFNWAFAWDILGEQILKVIPQGKSYCPVRDPEGSYTYLSEKYSLKDITNVGEIAIQKLVTAIFGDPEEIPDEEFFEEVVSGMSPESLSSIGGHKE